MKLLIITLTITILVFLVILAKQDIFKINSISNQIETFTDTKITRAPSVVFPFKNIKDENSKNTNVIAIVAPFRNKEHREKYQEYLKQGYRFLGICSYLQFPCKIDNKYEPASKEDLSWYLDKCMGWMTCFRNPRQLCLGAKNIPIIEMAQSDFTDPKKVIPKDLPIRWDFIYICLKDNDKCQEGWNSLNRNWGLAKECFVVMCLKYGLKGVIIGRTECPRDDSLKPYLTYLDQLNYHEFIKTINQSRFTFLPNTSDASPRTLTESLCLNKPVLVNRDIIGGWKYVNNNTGEFFTNVEDIKPALERLINNYDQYQPRKYFSEHYGPKIYGPKLAKFIKHLYPDFTDCQRAEPYCCD